MTSTISATVQIRLHSTRLTEMFKKILSLLLSVIVLFVAAIPAFAETTAEVAEETTAKSGLLIIICEPKIELTDYDTVYLRAYNLNSGETYAFKLYGYNDFSDKFVMPEGDYLITELSLVDRANVILMNSNPSFTVHGSTTVTIPIANAGIIISGSTETTENETTGTTYHNPFVYTEKTEATSEISSTLGETDESQEQTNNGLSSQTNTTTQKTEDEPQESSNKSGKIILFVIGVLVVIAIAFVIAVKRRNRE